MSVNSKKSVTSLNGKKVILRFFYEVLLLTAALGIFFILANRALPKIAIAQIEELTNTKIDIESVNLSLNGSVLIKGLVISPPGKAEYDGTIFSAKTVYARFGIGSLLLLRPKLKKINVADFTFNAQYEPEKDLWNLAGLKFSPPKGGSGKIPLIRLKNGTLRFSKVSQGTVKVTAEVPIDVKFKPSKETKNGYSFDITTAQRAGFAGKSTLSGSWEPGRISISGGISSTDIPAFERAWMVYSLAAELNYDKNNDYSLKLIIKDLLSRQKSEGDVSVSTEQTFLKKFGPFTALQEFLKQYNPWGQVDIDLKASGNLDRISQSTLAGKVYCRDIMICDSTFPYSIENIVGWIDFTDKSVSLNNLSGRHNDVKLFIDGWVKDFGPNWQCQIQMISDNMSLDDDLYKALNENQKKLWSAFSPAGLAAIKYCFSREEQTDGKSSLEVHLHGIKSTCTYFPYPLRNLTGTLLFAGDNITLSGLVSEWDGHRINIDGKVTDCQTSRPIYDISIAAKDIPLDSTLSAALPAKQNRFYSQFCKGGLADVGIKIFTPGRDLLPVSFVADVFFKNISFEINQSLLVVTDISGKAVFTPDLISIENLEGRNGQGLVYLSGQIRLGQETEEPSYRLTLKGEKTQLSRDFINMLPKAAKNNISKLQPAGMINYSLDLDKNDKQEYPDYNLTIDCLGDSIDFETFPYPLKDITGSIKIKKDSITLEDITATTADNVQITSASPIIKMSGQVDLVDGTFGSGRFKLCANDILLDERLSIALPESIQNSYRGLSPTGRFDLDLESIKIFNAADGEQYIDFAGAAKLSDWAFNVSPPLTRLNAVLKAKGLYKTDESFCQGQVILTADGLRIKGKSLTGLKAIINYSPDQHKWLSENMVADCYDGKFTGKFEMKRSPEQALMYSLQVGFEDIDLKQFLSDTEQEKAQRDDYTSGDMSGSLSIVGHVGDSSSRLGSCKLQITNMQVGRLSSMAKLLIALKLTESSDYAFDRMFIDSYIKHNRLLFERFDLSGRAIAFNGSGWLDLQTRDLNLVLTARGKRLATEEPGVLQSLTEGLGHGVVRMIVTGKLSDPQVVTTALPVIREAMGILGTKPAAQKQKK